MPPRTERFMRNSRGQRLYTVHHKVPHGSAVKAALVFHHGYGEHIGRYEEVFQRLASSGYAVHSLDAHGHGKSEPLGDSPDRCLVLSFNHLIDDLLQLVRDEVLPLYPTLGAAPAAVPLFLAGHSMGGMVASHAALREPSLWSGLVLHSALIDASWTLILRLQAPIGNVLAALVPRARLVPAVKPENMSEDPALVKKYIEDPLNFVGNVRARTANELLKGFRSLALQQHDLQVPIYACHGTQDKVTSLPAVQAFLAAVKSKDVTLRLVHDGYHELLHGPASADCTRHIVQWLDGHLQAAWAPGALPSLRSRL